MPGDHRKKNKQSTGTVPKIKPYDFSTSLNVEERPTAYANNLTTYGHHPPDSFNILRNRRGTQQNNYFTMDTAMDGFLPSVQNMIANETTANTSSSNSRRNSSGSTLKCDNITKYPDKNQVEQKLEQIREYLKITSSLMTSMRNTDEQTGDFSEIESLEKMISDLKDSESKLTGILDHMNAEDGIYDEQAIEGGMDELSLHGTSSNIRNDIDINLDDPNHEIDALKEQQLSLMQLQQKAEYKLRGARQIHSNLLQASNESNSITNAKDSKNFSDFDAAIRELEERAKRLRPAEANNRTEDHFLAGVETLHNQMMSMRCANNEREHLIEALDTQDAALRSEHEELQSKLAELQKKKSQVDTLVAQLQSFGEEEDGDVGGQVRTIVTMKEQLKKLKDMLEIVKTTENIMQNTNASAEVQAAASDICSTAENFLDKKLPARVSNDTGTGVKPKQVNRSKKEQGAWRVEPSCKQPGNKSKRKWNDKKKGLEDIMGRHKASTSNLNHNVGFGADNKSETNVWSPPSPQASASYSTERIPRYRYNDERPDVNPYVITSDHNLYYQPPMIASPDSKPPTIFYADKGHSPDYWNQPRSNIEQNDKPEVQEKLKWVKRMCDTMLDNQTTPNGFLENQTTSNGSLENQATSNVSLNQQNVRQLRNNLTPSQLSEPPNVSSSEPPPSHEVYVAYRRPGCPCPKCQEEDSDAADSADESPYEVPAEAPAELTVVDVLKQFSELMWTQQREFQSLKSSVAWIQNKLEGIQFGAARDDSTAIYQNPPSYRMCANSPSSSNQKVNHVSAAFSLPNLNQYIPPPVNKKPKSTDYASVPNDRSLDPGVTNAKANLHAVAHANNLLRTVSSNHGQVLPNPMWNNQALNNQVAPGNRANNYWDNFRSYSRQNLLSTKNIDLHNPSALDRSNAVNEQTHPFMVSHPVCKSEPGSTVTCQATAPHGRCVRYDVNPTPDVLNVNRGDQARAPSRGERHNNTDEWTQMLLGLNNSAPSHSNVCEEWTHERNRRRNEWTRDVSEEQLPKSKAFAESREKVYKEVASLISANESRPHFLIQLFKGLQMIDDSESSRMKTLQAIHMLITESPNERLAAQKVSQQPDQQSSRQHDQQSYRQPTQQPDTQPMQPKIALKKLPVWSPKSLKNVEVDKKSSKYQTIETQIGAYLDEHSSDVITNTTIVALRYLLTGSPAFGRMPKDVHFWKHFSKVVENVLLQYRGNRIGDVKALLIQTVADLDFSKENRKYAADHQLPYLMVEEGHNNSDFIQEVGAQEQQNDSAGLAEQTANDQEAAQQLSDQQTTKQLPRLPDQTVSTHPPGWPKTLSNFKIYRRFSNRQFIEMEIGSYLDQHRNDVVRDTTIIALIQLLFDSSLVGNAAEDSVFVDIEDALQQFIGSRLGDVRDLVIQALATAVPVERFTFENRDSAQEHRLPDLTNGEGLHNLDFPQEAQAQEQLNNSPGLPKSADNIENEDLAEADQSRIIKEGAEEEEDEEEGAVGGVMDMTMATESDDLSKELCDEDAVSADTIIEGLDQVPTKLPIKVKSRSSTPNKDTTNTQSESGQF